MEAVAVRFTILATTGAEPCLDELEIIDGAGRNVALTGPGITVTASGTLAGNPRHRLEHLNDGQPGNSHSWISDTPGKGWVQIDLPVLSTISRVVWSRDREGKFTDRLATDYRVETATSPGQWKVVASSRNRENQLPDPEFLLPLFRLPKRRRRLRPGEDGPDPAAVDRTDRTPGRLVRKFYQPGKTHRLYRGDRTQPREVVAPDSLTVLVSWAFPWMNPNPNAGCAWRNGSPARTTRSPPA